MCLETTPLKAEVKKHEDKDSPFQAGDTVIVNSPIKKYDSGHCGWVNSMDKFVGKTMTISPVRRGGCFTLMEDSHGWGFAPEWLTLVTGVRGGPVQPKGIKLEVGKSYLLRDGRTVKIDRQEYMAEEFVSDTISRGQIWMADGSKWGTPVHYDSQWDIVAEVQTIDLDPVKPEDVKVEKPKETFTLSLTREEARTLRMITGAVLGSETDSRRAHTDRIYHTLGAQGIESENVKGEVRIHFDPEKGLFAPEEPEKPKLHLITFDIYKTRRGGLVQVLDGKAVKPRYVRVRRLDDKVEYNVHPTGEAHDDKSTCPDDVIELVSHV